MSCFIYCYTECHNAECPYAECHCHYAQCRYVEWNNTECRVVYIELHVDFFLPNFLKLQLMHKWLKILIAKANKR